eukprot:TRINITY_DN23586_c0_g1_i1.p2 TRINITY_DN23586_c0_g1~~TRINITY_DN23586_c0_g1_i1.p2  ORF type:complete len:177 (-),score=26.69 TRINITY_DN23586_c0_g1_i1:109-639(-)
MWKLKVLSTIGGPLAGVSGIKYAKYVRYAGLATGVAFLLLGIIGCIIGPLWVGLVSIVFGFPVIALELPFMWLAKFQVALGVLNFFNDYRWRAVAYVVLCIIPFFNSATILAGIMSVLTAAGWMFCWWKDEKGPEIKPENDAGAAAAPAGQEMQPAQAAGESNSKKKFSLASLGFV